MTNPAPIAAVFRLLHLTDPVLIAAHGDNYHDPKVLARSWAGATLWLDRPRCGAHADRWVAVDQAFAELIERTPCAPCAAVEAGQLSIQDAEIPTSGLDEREEETP